MPSSRFLPILPLAVLLVLPACQSTPDKPVAACPSSDGGTKPQPRKEETPESKDGFFSKGAFKWPWEKDKVASEGEAEAGKAKPAEKSEAHKADKPAEEEGKSGWHWPWQKKDQTAPVAKDTPKVEHEDPLPAKTQNSDQLPEGAPKPKKKGWFAGWHWPWQKKKLDEEAENPEPAPHPVDALPTRPVPVPEAIQPRMPEPGLAPSEPKTPRGDTKERDPLSGIGLHPGS